MSECLTECLTISNVNILFCILTATYECFSCFTSVQALGIVTFLFLVGCFVMLVGFGYSNKYVILFYYGFNLHNPED